MSRGDASAGENRSAPRQSAAWVEPGTPEGGTPVGEARTVTGGSRVVFAEAARVEAQPEPQGRRISEEEIAERGLLQERVIEIGEMREEAVVSKQAFVREELVVRRDVEQRTERVAGTLRRTEVDVERLEPGRGDGEDATEPPGR